MSNAERRRQKAKQKHEQKRKHIQRIERAAMNHPGMFTSRAQARVLREAKEHAMAHKRREGNPLLRALLHNTIREKKVEGEHEVQ